MAPRKNYTQEQMNQALQLVRRGTSVAEAARQTGVPRSTLLYKNSGKSPEVCSMGPVPNLNYNEQKCWLNGYWNYRKFTIQYQKCNYLIV